MNASRHMIAALVAAGAVTAGPLAPSTAGQQQATGYKIASHHVVEFTGSTEQLESSVRAAGGRIDYAHETGIAKVSGLSAAAAAALGRSAGVRAVTQDVKINFVRPLSGNVRTLSIPDPGATAHNPADAAFFEFQWNMRQISADAAWAAGYSGSPSVRVAVLDTGIDPFHIDMFGRIDIASSRAFTPSLNPAGPDWGDDQFHGTHVASMITTNGIGTSGVAPHTTLIAVKVLDVFGDGTFGDVIAGILHAADEGADVINMSLGAGVPPNVPGGAQLIAALKQAVGYAHSKGALVVSASGNDGVDLISVRPIKAVPCESGHGICISATGPNDTIASYSNYGSGVIDLAAPGGDFDPANVEGSLVLGPCSSLSLLVDCTSGLDYLLVDGTSMATPHVSGAAALLDAQYGGGLTANTLMTRLAQAADDLGAPGRDQHYGKGRINVLNTLTR